MGRGDLEEEVIMAKVTLWDYEGDPQVAIQHGLVDDDGYIEVDD